MKKVTSPRYQHLFRRGRSRRERSESYKRNQQTRRTLGVLRTAVIADFPPFYFQTIVFKGLPFYYGDGDHFGIKRNRVSSSSNHSLLLVSILYYISQYYTSSCITYQENELHSHCGNHLANYSFLLISQLTLISLQMFFVVCLSMIAVIVANPTPADNEGGKIAIRNFIMRNLRNLSLKCFFIYRSCQCQRSTST